MECENATCKLVIKSADDQDADLEQLAVDKMELKSGESTVIRITPNQVETLHYLVSEEAGSESGVTYDSRVWKIDLMRDDQNNIITAVFVDGTKEKATGIKFTTIEQGSP